MAFLGLRRKQERVPAEEPPAKEPGGNGAANVPAANAPMADEPAADGTATAPPVKATRAPVGAAGRVRVEATTRGRRLGLGLVGLLILLTGAWAGVVPYVGPIFGYSSHGQPSWQWNLQHSLLYLIPGAVAVVYGLLIIAAAGRVARRQGSIGSGVLGLIVAACGAWLVLGPVVWPLFYSSPVFTSGSAWDNFIYQLGYNLGPGLVLVLLSGLAMGMSARAGRAVTAARPTRVPETPETTWMTPQSA
jgi:hypothetical protein